MDLEGPYFQTNPFVLLFSCWVLSIDRHSHIVSSGLKMESKDPNRMVRNMFSSQTMA
jgi:hypothetical protein